MANRKNFAVSMQSQGLTRTNSNPSGTSYTDLFQSASRTASDYSRRKSRSSWLKPTSYSMQEISKTEPHGSYKFHQTSSPSTNWTEHTGVLRALTSSDTLFTAVAAKRGFPLTYPADLSNRALINARNNLKGVKLDLGVAFGERRETARFVGDTLSDMGRFAWNLARKRPSKKATQKFFRKHWRNRGKQLGVKSYQAALKQFNAIPDRVLQYHYAVKPLMSDIHGAVHALDDVANGDWKVTVKGKSNYKDKCDVVLYTPGNSNYCDAKGETLYGCLVRIDVAPGSTTLRKAKEFGFTNPVNTAWELLKLSFVLDWAWPLGDYFSSFDAMIGWDLLGCSTSAFTKHKYEFTGRNAVSGSLTFTSAWSAKYRIVKVDRVALTSVPFPMLPSIKDPFSTNHVTAGLALLSQGLKALSRR